MKTVFIKPAEAERKWFVIDAEGKVLGRVAARVASILRGKEKAIFAPHQELGDYVVVINADKVLVTGRKPQQKMYYRYSGFIGGMKADTFEELMARHPADPLELAIKGMLPKGPWAGSFSRTPKSMPERLIPMKPRIRRLLNCKREVAR